MIKTLIVDDSAVVRAMLRQVMSEDSRFDVAALAENGKVAVQRFRELRPDLIIMDYHMPIMDGLEAVRLIFAENSATPPAIVMFSTENDEAVKGECKNAGVLEFIAKPSLANMTNAQLREFCDTLCDVVSKKDNYYMLRPAYKNLPRAAEAEKPAETAAFAEAFKSGANLAYDALLIGASTGGPEAVQKVLSDLGRDFPLPVLITQHIDSAFDKQFAYWLNSTTIIKTKLAETGDIAEPGRAYIAPSDKHLAMKRRGGKLVLELSDAPPVHFLRPAVDVMFRNAAQALPGRTVAVLLTGMGRDGAEGLAEIAQSGGHTICQDEATCVVYGMPKAAVDLGAAQQVLPLGEIAPYIRETICGGA